MNKYIPAIIVFIAWIFLIELTHDFIHFFVDKLQPPYWMSELTYFIIAYFYVYIFLKYRVRIEIHIEDKQIFYFRNRGK